ncbi:nuclear transport factor 2 family protein [Aurantivibrio plasticivorans]
MMKRSRLVVLALGLVLVGLIGCDDQSQKISELEARLNTIENEARYTSDVLAIWKLQSRYQHYINIGARQDIVSLFADHPDVEIELSNKGIVRGADAPHRYFLRAGQPKPATPPKPIPGFMVMHMSVNPAIEINHDGTQAKAVWLSPGITNIFREGKMKAGWNFGKYEMEYIKQESQWKILSFRWHQIFLTPYDKGWVEENIHPGSVGAAVKPDQPSAPDFYRPYDATSTDNRFDPPPPEPY